MSAKLKGRLYRPSAVPWFLVGLGLFCVFVAMEEISWGQRVFGHTPPEYFLAKNYQQELNLLDPWNLPYWVRDTCDDFRGRRVVFIYSFGPNRSRDSTPWEILGDDVGVFLVEEEEERYRP